MMILQLQNNFYITKAADWPEGGKKKCIVKSLEFRCKRDGKHYALEGYPQGFIIPWRPS